MDDEVNHNKIINQVALDVLKKHDLFKKGQSRIWIDDNGWFLIIVEFQPSNWDKGSYLNVGINYLWDNKDYLSFDYGYRQNDFVLFKGSGERFYADMVSLAEKAMKKVIEYRKLQQVEFAKKQILKRNQLYHKMMICGLAKDNAAVNFYGQLLKETQASGMEYKINYYKELSEKIALIINDTEQFHDYVTKKIMLQREFWHSKSSMKKLSSSFPAGL